MPVGHTFYPQKVMAAYRERRKIEVSLKEMDGERKLVETAIAGNLEEATSLIQTGVSVDAVDYNKHLFYQSENYMTPLQYATAKGFPSLVKLFINCEGMLLEHITLKLVVDKTWTSHRLGDKTWTLLSHNRTNR